MQISAIKHILVIVLLMTFTIGCQQYTVTKTEDTNDGECTEDDCSLREAVLAANLLPGEDEIIVPAGTYVLTLSGKDEDAAATGDLDILYDVVISGESMEGTIINGNLGDRVFDARNGNLELNNLTVTRGRVDTGGAGVRVLGEASIVMDTVTIEGNSDYGPTQPGYGGMPTSVGQGGGLYSEGDVDLKDVIISTNQNIREWERGFAIGAGVYVSGPKENFSDYTGEYSSVRMENVRIYNNRVQDFGGGMYIARYVNVELNQVDFEHNGTYDGSGGGLYRLSTNDTTLAITDSRFYDNWANLFEGGLEVGNQAEIYRTTIEGNYAGESGGGLSVGWNILIRDTTISDNESGGAGGGIYIFAGAELENVTISGNTARWGGGLYINGDLPLTKLINCTVVDNKAENLGPALYVGALGELEYVNTIFANNDCYSTVLQDDRYPEFSIGNNLADSDTCGMYLSTDIIAPPMIGPLADNGGPTLTHALLGGSPAIDSGSTALGTDADQRGFTRPAVGESGESITDIGAYEFQIATPIERKPGVLQLQGVQE